MNKRKVPKIRFKGFHDDWEQRKFTDIVTEKLTNGVMNRQSESPSDLKHINVINMYTPDKIHVEDLTDSSWDESAVKKCNVQVGDIFLTRSSLKPEGIAEANVLLDSGRFVFDDHLIKMRVDQEQYDPFFVKVLLSTKTVKNQFIAKSKQNAFTTIGQEDIAGSYGVFPVKGEQKKIGIYFQILDHLITLHQRKLEKLKIIKKSMIENCFSKSGEKVPKIRFSGFSDDWEQRKVREVTDRYDNLRIPVAASLRIAGTTPYYGANGIQDYVEGYTHDGEFILVAEDGANDLKNYPVKCVKGRIWVNNHAHVLQGKCACADNQFLAYAISQADIESLLVGGGRAKLNAETLMDIELLLPSKDEQTQIGTCLARLDHLITLHQSKLEKLKMIKKSMLETMFV